MVAAALVWRPGRGLITTLLVTLALFALVVVQLGFGFEGRLALHLPNALMMFTGQFVLLALAHRDQAESG